MLLSGVTLSLRLAGLLLLVLRDGFGGGVDDDESDDLGTSTSGIVSHRILLAEGCAIDGGA